MGIGSKVSVVPKHLIGMLSEFPEYSRYWPKLGEIVSCPRHINESLYLVKFDGNTAAYFSTEELTTI